MFRTPFIPCFVSCLLLAASSPAEEATKEPVAPDLVDLGDFGSDAPAERADMPTRGVIAIKVEEGDKAFAAKEHWEEYNFSFKAKRWGKYAVRITYTLKSSSLGVQFKLGENRLKKQIQGGDETSRHAWLGNIYLANAGEQSMSLYTPNHVAWDSFILHEIALVPAPEGEKINQAEDGSVLLLAKDAATWSENMRYEPQPNKNCLGYWTDVQDFAEWEMKVDKPGKYQVVVHQGSSPGGSEIAVQFDKQELKFTVQNTGDFHKLAPVSVGEIKVDKPGTYRLAVKPQKKNGGAIMDIQKVVLTPVS
ncbi:MAG: DUF5077 domain-containing protein [Verrucomicrobiaceae bacterium]